jgi:hypothetical protein
MILDSVLQFNDAKAYTSLNGTAQNATNIIDLGAATTGKDAFGNNEAQNLLDITWFVNIQVAMGTASKIMYVDLVTGSATSSSAISSSVVLARIEFPAESAAGTKRSMRLQTGKIGRYLGEEYTATATLATVTVDSGLVLGYNDSPVSEKFQG